MNEHYTHTHNENYTSNKINEIDDGNIYAMWWQFCKCDVFVNFIKEEEIKNLIFSSVTIWP